MVIKCDFALINVHNTHADYGMNKDLNGGLGTADNLRGSLLMRVLRSYRKKSFKLPVLSLVFLQAILRKRNFTTMYFEFSLPDASEHDFKVILIYGSIVDFRNELRVARTLRASFPGARIGFFGPFVSVRPDLFRNFDFHVVGEAESFFHNDYKRLAQLKGKIRVGKKFNFNSLPEPDLDGFDLNKYRYSRALPKRPFFAWQTSWGCPYACSYYCTYGKYQGSTIRQTDAAKVVNDLEVLSEKYGIRSVQFRDPIFGLKKGFIEEFCQLLTEQKLKLNWGIETRLDLLTPEKITLMHQAGLRNINAGIETVDSAVAAKNHRKLVEARHQEALISMCDELGVHVTALYMIGLEGDSTESIKKTVEYSRSLKTSLARFAIYTPFPGTRLYDKMQKEQRLVTEDLERYNQFEMVFSHKNLKASEIKALLKHCYRRYYLRPKYLAKTLVGS